MPIDRATARIPSVTVPITLTPLIGADGEPGPAHQLIASLAFHPRTGALHELVFVHRGKSGHGLDVLLADLAIKLSRAIQGRDPETGAVETGAEGGA